MTGSGKKLAVLGNGPDSAEAEGEGLTPAPAPGPRNPWHAPGGRAPRRSASIEDIFRLKDRRSGGPNSGGDDSGDSGSGPRLPTSHELSSWLPMAIAGLAALWLLGSSVHQLGSNQQGVITTFGKYNGIIGPGLSLSLPWPIQSVAVTDVTSIRRESIPDGDAEKLMLTSDQNLVDLSYLVRWNIRDLKLYSFQLENPAAAIREVAEAAMRASVAEVPLNNVMGGTGRAQIEHDVRVRMQAVLDAYRSGVVIQGVDLKKTDPPERVNAAFQKVSVAQQEAQRDQSQARAWAQQVVARAQGDTANFDKVYEQYKLAPTVTRQRMYYETMERVLSNNDKVIVQGGVNSYLPLPEIRRKADSKPVVGPEVAP